MPRLRLSAPRTEAKSDFRWRSGKLIDQPADPALVHRRELGRDPEGGARMLMTRAFPTMSRADHIVADRPTSVDGLHGGE